jgi:hypothetical protein
LNSKSEFIRCRLPRLTINRDDWLFRTETTTVIANPIAKDNPEGFPVEGGSFHDELGDSALWRIGKHDKAVKRKKEKEIKTDNIPGGRKRKKARLERLENWGETEKECETDLRSWLVTPTETPRASKKMKQLEI